jgi:two-component system nitrate/nitrite response regulator NarL
MLDLVASGVRVMVAPNVKYPALQPAQPKELRQSGIKVDKLQSDGAEHEDVSVDISALHTKPPVNGASTGPNPSNGEPRCVPALRTHPKLSEREVQIVNGLVKGHANKVIARTCDIAEATVKVHIKSILRKARVGNRTQAAIWALESGYTAV